LLKKLATFGYVGAFFSNGNLTLFWQFLNWSANERKTLSLSDHSLGEGVGGVTLESEGSKCKVDNLVETE
jgi:hypothetical protein